MLAIKKGFMSYDFSLIEAQKIFYLGLLLMRKIER